MKRECEARRKCTSLRTWHGQVSHECGWLQRTQAVFVLGHQTGTDCSREPKWFRTDDRGPWPVTTTELVPPSPWIAGGFSLRTEDYTPLKVLSPWVQSVDFNPTAAAHLSVLRQGRGRGLCCRAHLAQTLTSTVPGPYQWRGLLGTLV